MASTFTEARLTNRLATEALRQRDAAKARAATTDPSRDVHAETAARVKLGGPWVRLDPDSTFGANSGKQRT